MSALFDWLKRLFGLSPRSWSPFPSGAGPSRLVVLRHAEKSGDKSDPHLSPAGKRRAEELVRYIPATFGRPEFLIAARTSNRSRRPVETLEPLAASLALEIRAKLDNSETSALVEKLKEKQRHRGKLGVICWRHSDLPRLLAALGVPEGTCPARWDGSDYTTVFDIAYRGVGDVRVGRIKMPF